MRKYIWMSIAALLLGMGVFAQSRHKPTLAVMDLTCAGISPDEAIILTESLLSSLYGTHELDVVEIGRRNEILREQGFVQTGACNETSCLIEAGRYLAVEKMVGGSVGKIEETWSVNIRLIDVETGMIEKVCSSTFRGPVDSVFASLGAVGREIAWAALPIEERARRDSVILTPQRAAREKQVRDSLAIEANKTKLRYPALTYGSLATSGALAGAAVFFYLKAKSAYDDYTKASLTVDALHEWDRTTRFSRAATWCSALSAGLAGTAIASWFVKTRVHPEMSRTAPTSSMPILRIGLGQDGCSADVCWRF